MDTKKEITQGKNAEWLARGKRLQQLRIMARLERDSAAKLAGLARSSYKLVEVGVNNLTKERAAWFVNGIHEMGIDVEVEWLLTGVGDKPRKSQAHTDSTYRSNLGVPNDVLEAGSLDQRLIEKELDCFCRNHVNSVYLVIPDDSMVPLYQKGDVVAGEQHSMHDISKFLGQDCIVTLSNGTRLLRNLNPGREARLFTLLALNPHAPVKILSDVELQNAAPVLWHRRLNKW